MMGAVGVSHRTLLGGKRWNLGLKAGAWLQELGSLGISKVHRFLLNASIGKLP